MDINEYQEDLQNSMAMDNQIQAPDTNVNPMTDPVGDPIGEYNKLASEYQQSRKEINLLRDHSASALYADQYVDTPPEERVQPLDISFDERNRRLRLKVDEAESLGLKIDRQLVDMLNTPEIVNDTEKLSAMLDEYTDLRFNLKTVGGAVWNKGEPFKDATAYRNTIQSMLMNGYKATASEQYRAWMDAVGDQEKMIKAAGIDPMKTVYDEELANELSGYGTSMPGSAPRKKIRKSDQEILREISEYDQKVRSQNFVQVYSSLSYDFNDLDKELVDAAVRNKDGLPSEWGDALYLLFQTNPDKAVRACNIIEASRNKREGIIGDMATAFGDGLKRLGLFNSEYGFGRFVENTTIKFLRDGSDSPENRVRNQIDHSRELEERRAFLMIEDALSSKPANTYGWMKRGLIDVAATIPYMAMTAVPFGIGDAMNVLGQFENVRDDVIAAGGDPEYANGWQMCAAIAWAGVEHLEGKVLFGKPMSNVQKRLMVASLMRGMDFRGIGSAIAKGEGKIFGDWVLQCTQEGIQQAIEDGTVASVLGKDFSRIDDNFVQSFARGFSDSIVSMGILSHAGRSVRASSDMIVNSNYSPLPEYAARQIGLKNIAEKKAYVPELGEKEQEKATRTVVQKWFGIWSKNDNKVEATEQIRTEFGLTQKEAESVASYFYFRDEAVDAIKNVRNENEKRKLAASMMLLDSNQFSTSDVASDSTVYDPVSLFMSFDPNIQVEEVTIDLPGEKTEESRGSVTETPVSTEREQNVTSELDTLNQRAEDLRKEAKEGTTSRRRKRAKAKLRKVEARIREQETAMAQTTETGPVPSVGDVREGGPSMSVDETESKDVSSDTAVDVSGGEGESAMEEETASVSVEKGDVGAGEETAPQTHPVKARRITVPITRPDGTVTTRSYFLVEQEHDPDITTRSFAQSVASAMGDGFTPEDYLKIPDDEKPEFLEAYGLKQHGGFRLLNGDMRDALDSEGIVEMVRANSGVSEAGGNWTLTHEHGHAITRMARTLGIFGDESDPDYNPDENKNVQLFRKLFGEPTGPNELFNEENFSNAFADFLNGGDLLNQLEDQQNRTALGVIFEKIADFVRRAYSYITGKPYRKKMDEYTAMRKVLDAVSRGDFSALDQIDPGLINNGFMQDLAYAEESGPVSEENEDGAESQQLKDGEELTDAEDRLAEGGYSSEEAGRMKKDVETVASAGETRHSVSSMMSGVGVDWSVDDEGRVTVYHPGTRNPVTAKNPLKGSELQGEGTNMGRILSCARKWSPAKGNVDKILDIYAQILNKAVDYVGDNENGIAMIDAIWKWAGSSIFKSVKNNGDAQYSLSIDMTTICKKTEQIINAVSAFQVKHKRGCTAGEVIRLYLETGKKGYQTPCPCCYVFSHWIKAGMLYETAWMAQNTFDKEIKSGSELSRMTPKQKDEYAKRWLKKFIDEQTFAEENKKAIKEAKEIVDASYEILDRAMAVVAAESSLKAKGLKYNKKALELSQKILKEMTKKTESAYQLIARSDFAGWIKNNVLWVKELDDGSYKTKIRNDYKYVPAEILFAYNRSNELVAGYPSAARFRGSKGPSGGKAIETDADNEIGEVISGLAGRKFNPSRPGSYNPFANVKARMTSLRAAFRSAMLWAARQRLRGGQRIFSWSDNLVRFGPDMFINFMQLELIGASVQSYSKQLEGVELICAMGGYNNGSLMAQGRGYEEIKIKDGDTIPPDAVKIGDKYFRLLFSKVQGINAEELFKLNKKYDKSGNILVGMNDNHNRIALADPRIFFVIPWHASGLRPEWLYRMMAMLGEPTSEASTDYSKVQNDSLFEVTSDTSVVQWNNVYNLWSSIEEDIADARANGGIGFAGKDLRLKSSFKVSLDKKGVSKSQREYRDLRRRLIAGECTEEDISKAMKDEFLSQIVRKLEREASSFPVELRTGKDFRRVGDHLMLVMKKSDANSIFPWEYWDEKSTYTNQNVNGWRYLEYCRRMGAVPKFCGINTHGSVAKVKSGDQYGDFHKWDGYCKTLIDRRMYDRSGRYQDTTPVKCTGMKLDMITAEGLSKWGHLISKSANILDAEEIADNVAREEEQEGLDISSHEMTKEQALKRFLPEAEKYRDIMKSGQADQFVAEVKRANPTQGGEVEFEEESEEDDSDNTRHSVGPVYSGSREGYDKPSIIKVGSGRGQSVYGYGLYASSSKGVASGYASDHVYRAKRRRADVSLNGVPIAEYGEVFESVVEGVMDEIDMNEDNFDKALQVVETMTRGRIGFVKDKESRDKLNDRIEAIEKIKDGKVTVENLRYEQVEHPAIMEQTWWTNRPKGDTSHLIDLNKDVSSENLERINSGLSAIGKNPIQGGNGIDAYNRLIDILGGKKEASEFLYRNDIDGSSYRDPDSGETNYIAFSDENLRVDHRYDYDADSRRFEKRYSVTPEQDQSYLDAVKAGDMETAQKMVDEVAKKNGYTPVLRFHQTERVFSKFSTANPKAGKNDSETPNGIFVKTNDHDIGLGGNIQMRLYLQDGKYLYFADRKQANKWYRSQIDGYAELDIEMNNRIKVLEKKDDELDAEMYPDDGNISDEKYDKLYEEQEKNLKKMWEVDTEYRSKMRSLLDDYFLGGKSGYDGIELAYDGSRRINGKIENVHTFIVFHGSQLKSADPVTYDDEGKVIPLSKRFDSTQDDIRYSITREQEEFFRNSKVRDEDGNLIPVYHATGEDFTVFDREKLGGNTLVNASSPFMASTAFAGFWFNTQDLTRKPGSGYSDRWGDQGIKVYLNITTPYRVGSLADLEGEIEESYMDIHGDDEEAMDDLERAKAGDEGLKERIAREASDIYVNKLREDGYDGIEVQDEEMGETSYVIFESNQAKKVDNTSPTEDPDIRYSVEGVRGGDNKKTSGKELPKLNPKKGDRDTMPKVTLRKSAPQHSPVDIVTGHLAAQITGGKKVSLSDVRRRLDAVGAKKANERKVMERAVRLANRKTKSAKKEVLREGADLVDMFKTEAQKQRLGEIIGDAVTKGAAISDPNLGSAVTNLARKKTERDLAAAKGFTAAEMQAELPIDLTEGLYAVVDYHAQQRIPFPVGKRPKDDSSMTYEPIDYREPTSEERSYYDSLMERAGKRSIADRYFENPIREKKEERKREIDARNEKAKEARAKGLKVEEKKKEDAGEEIPDFGKIPDPEIKRIDAVFSDPFLFAGFVIEWAMDKIFQKHPELKEKKELWKNPIAIKELAQTAQNILETLINRTMGSSVALRKFIEDRIDSSKNPERYSALRRMLTEKGMDMGSAALKMMLDRQVKNLSGTKSYQKMKVQIANAYEAVRDYAIRTGSKALINRIRKIGDQLAKDGKRFSNTKEFGSRKNEAAVELWWRKVRAAISMSDYAVQTKMQEAMYVVGQYLSDQDSRPGKFDEKKYLDAQDWIAVLSQFGGLKNKAPGEIADKSIMIVDQLFDGRERFEAEREKRAEVCKGVRTAIIDAIRAGGDSSERSDPTRIGMLADSLIGSLRLRLEDMIAYCKDPKIREKALYAIKEIMVMISQSTAQKVNIEAQANAELNEGLRACYGSARSGLLHLNEALPENVAKRFFRQRRRGARPTYSNLIQLYGSAIQIDYKNNIREHHRDVDIEGMRQALTPQDLLFHKFAVEWYRTNRASLSEAVRDATGMPIYSPDKNYIPVRMLSEKTGLSSDMRNWTPIPSALSLRVRNKLDFDESVGILNVLQEQASVRANTIARTRLGITLRDILGHEDMKKAAREFLPDRTISKINQQVLDILIGGRSDNNPIVSTINIGRSWLARAYLSYNVQSATIQLTSIPVWANIVGFRKLLKYLNPLSIDWQAVRELCDNDGYKARYVAGWSEETQNVLRHPGKSVIAEFFSKVYNAGMKPLAWADKVASLWIGQGIYRDAKASNLDKGMSEEEAKAKAAALVWGYVEESQQSGREEYFTELQRRMPGLAGVFLQFMTSPLQQLAYEVQAIREVSKGTPGSKGRLARAILVNHVIVPALMHAVRSLIGLALGDVPDDDDDEEFPNWAKELCVEMVMGQSAPLFIVATLVEDLTQKLLGVKPRFHSGGSLPIEGIIRISTDGFRFFVDCGKYGVQELSEYDFEVTPEDIQKDLVKFLGDILAPVRMYNRYKKNHDE